MDAPRRFALSALALGLLPLLILLFAPPVAGVPTLTFDEAGIGTVFDGVTTTPLSSSTAFDPVSSFVTLAYALPFAPVPGDVIVTEPPLGGNSDLLRFSTALPGTLFVFSEPAEVAGTGELADVGIPSFITPFVIVPEVGSEGSNGITYSPAVGGPGFFPGVTYVFISDAPTQERPRVPAPSSAILLVASMAVGGLWRHWKGRNGRRNVAT